MRHSEIHVNKPVHVGVQKGSPNRPTTVLATGLPKGGTSALSAVLDALGVYMGPAGVLVRDGCFENHDFLHLKDPSEAKPAIKKLNAQHDLWGLKIPAGLALEFQPLVRNPCVIAVTRDPLAIATHHGYEHNLRTRGMDWVFEHFNNMQRLLKRIDSTGMPYFVLSYERMLRWPQRAVQELVSFLNLTPDIHQVCEALPRLREFGGYLGTNQKPNPHSPGGTLSE